MAADEPSNDGIFPRRLIRRKIARPRPQHGFKLVAIDLIRFHDNLGQRVGEELIHRQVF
jgi:hypothetical protein